MPDKFEAKDALVQFNSQKTFPEGMVRGMKAYNFLPDEFFMTSIEDDWTAVKVDGGPSKGRGQIDLESVRVTQGDQVSIIRYPGGLHKQVSYFANICCLER